MRAVGCGIDFGTSNSAVSIAYEDGSVQVLPTGNTRQPESVPSIGYLHRDGNRLAGKDAIQEFLVTGSLRTACHSCPLVFDDIEGRYSECKHHQPGGSCNDSRLFYALKSELSNPMFRLTHSWAVDFEMEDLGAVLLHHLRRLAQSMSKSDMDRVVLGVPVVFVGAEGNAFDQLQALAEERLVGAAHRAGFREVEVLYEPAAAVLGRNLQSGISVALDFGGGTFDVAVIERDEGQASADVIGLQGAAVGGTEFDGLIFDHLIAAQVGVGGQRVPASVRRELRTLMGVRSLLSNPRLRAVLDGSAKPMQEIIYGGHAYDFYSAIENAKLELSRAEEAKIEFHRPGVHVSATLVRSEFESWIVPHMRAVTGAIQLALEEAEVSADEVGSVVLTGGSSQIIRFRQLVSEVFPVAEVTDLPVFTAVAEGLGHEAARRWAA